MLFWWSIVCLAILLIGITKSGFGAGVGLMIVPMAVVAMDHTPYRAAATLGLMLPLLILGDLIAIWQYRRLFSLRIVRKLFPGTLLGVVIGGALLYWFHSRPPRLLVPLIKLEVGLESIVLVGLHWWRVWRGQNSHVTPGPVQNALVGAAAGASSTIAHAAGPIISLYLLPQGLDRQLFVGTCAIYFFLLNIAKLPVYGLNSMFTADVLKLAASMLPLVIVGAIFGFWVNRWLNDTQFSKIVYAATFLLGWYLLFDAVRSLVG